MANEDWLGMLLSETSPENSQFPNDAMANMLQFDNVMRPREDESSGAFYGVSGIKTEEPTVDINRLLYCTSDESYNKYISEVSCENTVKDNITNYSKNGNNMHNIKIDNKRYENNTTDQLLSSVNVRNYNITSVEDEFYNHSNIFLNVANKTTTDINSVVNTDIIYEDPIYNNVLWSETNSLATTAVYETPDSSRSPINITDPKNTNLMLDFQEVQFINDEISTPNIIDAIIENEKLDFTNGGRDKIIITTYTPDEVKQMQSESLDIQVENLLAESTDVISVGSVTATVKHPPKRNFVDFDDESSCSNDSDADYIPPSKQQKRRSAGRRGKEDDIFKTTGKRGRPPKRNCSISSDDYSQLDPNEAKYREMRHRNNEASRKSRFKRKNKEVTMAEEMKELETENIRLKAQVNELQKTVESYRDNLMKVMLHKK